MKKKLIIIGIILLVIILVVVGILVFKKEEDKPIELDKDKVVSKLLDQGYSKVEDNVYVIKLENDQGIVSNIFDFGNNKFQIYYEYKDINVLSEYNYNTDIASCLLIVTDNRASIVYDNKNDRLTCDANMYNWCSSNQDKIKDDYLLDIIRQFNKIIE